jgi:hypothetical protein
VLDAQISADFEYAAVFRGAYQIHFLKLPTLQQIDYTLDRQMPCEMLLAPAPRSAVLDFTQRSIVNRIDGSSARVFGGACQTIVSN